MNLNQYSQFAAQPGIAVDVIANLEILVPPIDEQHVIAQYLVNRTREIDMEQNEGIFARFMNEKSFQNLVTEWISREVYGRFKRRFAAEPPMH